MNVLRCDRCGAETVAAFSLHEPVSKGRVFDRGWITLTDAGGYEQYDLCLECLKKWHEIRTPVMKKFLADGAC